MASQLLRAGIQPKFLAFFQLQVWILLQAVNLVTSWVKMQGLNGILADEMGLGKTIQAMAFLSHLAEVSFWHFYKFRSVITIYFCFLAVSPVQSLCVFFVLNLLTGEKYMGPFSSGCPFICAEQLGG